MRPQRLPLLVVRLRALLGPDPAGARQSVVALLVGLAASLVGGLTLGAITGTLERLPGLLVLVPGAIGLRGMIFGALGSRLGTAIHTGTFRLSARRDTVLGQNVAAAAVLTLAGSVVLAVLAKGVTIGFGLVPSISVADFVFISVAGGVLASIVVLAFTVALAAGSARWQWDPDNVTAPVVTAAADMVTLPSLYLATTVVDVPLLAPGLAVISAVAAAVLVVAGLRSRLDRVPAILRESLPVLLVAGGLSLVAGLVLEQRLATLAEFPALLALVPPFLTSAGALGGIVSSRLATKLHLGVIEADAVPGHSARTDIAITYVLGLPLFALASVVADLAAYLLDLRSPGAAAMLGVALLGGLVATSFAVVVAYYVAVSAYRLGVDPDNVAIPLVTSSLDLVGSLSFILAVLAVGVL